MNAIRTFLCARTGERYSITGLFIRAYEQNEHERYAMSCNVYVRVCRCSMSGDESVRS